MARRWTQEDLQALSQRQYGLVSAPAPPLSPEAAAMRLARIRVMRRKLEALFEQHLVWTGMRSVFEPQVKFHPERQWRLDYFAADYRLAVELHGGTYTEGRHVRGDGFASDRAKVNAAIEMGIAVLEFTKEMLQNGIAVKQTEWCLAARGWKR